VFRDDLRDQSTWIASNLRPDSLSIINEPDTQQKNTGVAFTPALWADLNSTVARAVWLVAPAQSLGADTGTCNTAGYMDRLLAIPELDYISLHLYPLQNGWSTTAIDAVAQSARAAGKEIGFGEAWLYKAGSAELGADIASAADLFARDVFSFWQPLDIRFIQMCAKLARAIGPRFFSFFWTRNFYGSVTYDDSTKGLAPAELFRRINAAAGPNVAANTPNEVGLAAGDAASRRV
jgi:hypothetical protein